MVLLIKGLIVVALFMVMNGCVTGENKATVTTIVRKDRQVDINTASALELEEELHGVGPVIAQRIIASRNSKPFENIYDLRERNVVGKDLFSNIKEDIKIGTTTNKHSRRVSDS